MNQTFGVGLAALILGSVAGYGLGAVKPSENAVGHEMTMGAMMSSMNNELAGKQGDEFDQAFLAQMIVHHEGAVQMAEAARTNAQHAEIRELADAIISAQTIEIAQMRLWQASWYGAPAGPAPAAGAHSGHSSN